MSDRPRGFRRAAAAAFPLLLSFGLPAGAERIELVSRALPELVSDTGGSQSTFPIAPTGTVRQTMSADGRYVAFLSAAPNLIPGQVENNLGTDVFLHDRVAGTIVLVSHNAANPSATGNNSSANPSISADGRYVAFSSTASTLTTAADANNVDDVFLFDRDTGGITLISHGAGNPAAAASNTSITPVINTDGNWVVYASRAGNLVAGQVEVSTSDDVFLWERATNTSTLVSHNSANPAADGNFTSSLPVLSADGAWVAYVSQANNLVAGSNDAGSSTDVFLWSRADNTNRLVTHTPASPSAVVSGNCLYTRISADGASVLFLSNGTGYVTGSDTNSGYDAFLFDRATGAITLVSHAATSATTSGMAGLFLDPAALSADGNWVAFVSPAINYVTGQSDTIGSHDIFLWSRASSLLELVTRQPGLPTTTSPSASNATAYSIEVSADGALVGYVSRATQVVASQVDTAGLEDFFVFRRATGTNALVSGAGGSASTASDGTSKTPVFSGNGQWVAFVTTSSDVLPGVVDTNSAEDVLLHELATGATTLVSRHAAGSPSVAAAGPSLLYFAGGGNPVPTASLSADGRYVTFLSATDRLLPDQVDRNSGGQDVFHYDRQTGETRLVSHADGSLLTTGNGFSSWPVISADGRWVVFLSRATNLIAGQADTNNQDDVFLWDSQTGALTLVSRTAASAVTTAGGTAPLISSDGAWVAFLSQGTTVVAGQVDTPSSFDLFQFSRASGANTLVSHTRAGLTTTAGAVTDPSMSADGSALAFLTTNTAMVTNQSDTSSTPDAFLWVRATGALTLVSHNNVTNLIAAGGCLLPLISPDGNWVAFSTTATGMPGVVNDNNGSADLFLWERATNGIRLVSRTPAALSTTGNFFSQGVMLSTDASRVVFLSRASNLVGGTDTNNALDAFLYTRATNQVTLLSRAAAGATTAGNAAVARAALSADGTVATFLSAATDVVAGQTDTAGSNDLFSFQVATGAVKLLSHRYTSAAAGLAVSVEGGYPSTDGGEVVFTTADAAVVPNDHNARYDVFLWLDENATDLSITKTDGKTAAIPGQPVTYTITASNLGLSEVTGATVTDNFPAALQEPSWSCAASGGATCTTSGVGVLADTTILPAGSQVVYTVNATVAAEATGALDNTATVALPAGWIELNPSNNSATDSDTLTPRANLAVTLSDTPDPVGRGATLTYTIGVSNAGPSQAGSVSAVQTLPAGVTFTGAAGDGWSCGEVAGVVTCTRPSLAVGSAPALTVQVTAPVARGISTLSSGVMVSSAAEDTDGSDNTASAETAVPQPGITVTPTSSLVTTEAGGTATFTVVLDTAPLADVTIPLTSSDTDEGTVDPAALTFTTGDWSTPQTVTVTGVDDAFVDGDAPYTLQTGAAESTDAGYTGIDPADVTATNEDDDTAGLQVAPTTDLVTTEEGGTDTFTVVLTARPTQDVTLALESSDPGEGQPSPGSLTFTSEDWDTPQTVTVTGQDDDLSDGDVAYTIVLQATASSDPAFDGIDPADVAVTNQDDAAEGTGYMVPPCRLLDTRLPKDGPALTDGEVGVLTVHGGCGVPSTARAVAINVTAVGGNHAGQLLVYPGDLAEAPLPTALPVRARRNTALFSVLPLAADGSGTLKLEPRLNLTEIPGTLHVIVDVMGYFE